MKIKVEKTIKVEVDLSFVRIQVPVRYQDEDIPYDFPNRKNDWLDLTINADTGEILDFPKNFSYNVNMKVVDEGTYILLDQNKNEIAKIEQDYVPKVIPGEWGDYINLIIENGYVKNWKKINEHHVRDFFIKD